MLIKGFICILCRVLIVFLENKIRLGFNNAHFPANCFKVRFLWFPKKLKPIIFELVRASGSVAAAPYPTWCRKRPLHMQPFREPSMPLRISVYVSPANHDPYDPAAGKHTWTWVFHSEVYSWFYSYPSNWRIELAFYFLNLYFV